MSTAQSTTDHSKTKKLNDLLVNRWFTNKWAVFLPFLFCWGRGFQGPGTGRQNWCGDWAHVRSLVQFRGRALQNPQNKMPTIDWHIYIRKASIDQYFVFRFGFLIIFTHRICSNTHGCIDYVSIPIVLKDAIWHFNIIVAIISFIQFNV